MADEKYAVEQVLERVHIEGLDYAIQNWFEPEQIEDPKLAALWKQAKDALDAIEEIFDELEGDDKGFAKDGG